jgi:hypothetical protein
MPMMGTARHKHADRHENDQNKSISAEIHAQSSSVVCFYAHTLPRSGGNFKKTHQTEARLFLRERKRVGKTGKSRKRGQI